MHLVIDGDILVYNAAFGVETAHDFGDGQWVSKAEMADAQDRFDDLVANLRKQVPAAEKVTVALSDDLNWRKELDPSYKFQRTKVRRPILLKPMRQWLRSGDSRHTVKVVPCLEADDVMGIMATLDAKVIIATTDKDLAQIPGRHMHLDTFAKSIVTPEQGDYWHMRQTLTGDITDNYPGLRGVGPKKADAILQAERPLWESVKEAYLKAGKTEEDAVHQARLARILRASDYDFKSRKPILWVPA